VIGREKMKTSSKYRQSISQSGRNPPPLIRSDGGKITIAGIIANKAVNMPVWRFFSRVSTNIFFL